jgi:hypothetical protein
VAAVRLYKLKDEFGDRLELDVKAYPLRPGDRPSLPAVPGAVQGRMRAGAEARQDGLEFKPWPEGKPAPASSLPSLEAAKCAALQGEDAFRAYDLALFGAYFEECLTWLTERFFWSWPGGRVWTLNGLPGTWTAVPSNLW